MKTSTSPRGTLARIPLVLALALAAQGCQTPGALQGVPTGGVAPVMAFDPVPASGRIPTNSATSVGRVSSTARTPRLSSRLDTKPVDGLNLGKPRLSSRLDTKPVDGLNLGKPRLSSRLDTKPVDGLRLDKDQPALSSRLDSKPVDGLRLGGAKPLQPLDGVGIPKELEA